MFCSNRNEFFTSGPNKNGSIDTGLVDIVSTLIDAASAADDDDDDDDDDDEDGLVQFILSLFRE
jgi:hypothetical protein